MTEDVLVGHRMSSRMALVAGMLAVAAVFSGCGTDADKPGPRPLPPTGIPDLMWAGDVETGDLSQFEDTPWNVAGGASPPDVVSDDALVRAGRYSVGFTIPGESNGEGITSDSRNELEPRIDNFHDGDELYFGFSTYLADGFPVQDGWQVVTQWKNEGEGSPPLELGVEEGTFNLSGGAGHPDDADPFRTVLAPAETGVWTDWVFRIRFSPDPDQGEVEVWRNGELVLPACRPESGTLYPAGGGEDVPDEPTSYLKTGYYRNADISTPGTIYFDSWGVGTAAEAVAPPAR